MLVLKTDMCFLFSNTEEPNVKITFKVKGHGHNANAYLTKLLYRSVMYSHNQP